MSIEISEDVHREKLRRLLMQGPQTATFLLNELNVDQVTFSGLWAGLKDGIDLKVELEHQYALRRAVPDVNTPIPLFRVTEDGDIVSIGDIDPLQGGFYALNLAGEDRSQQVYQGIPFFLNDLQPQGYLGRMEPGKYPELQLPADIRYWTDDHVLRYLSHHSELAAGDLILGNESYARYIDETDRTGETVIANDERQLRYPEMAERSLRGEFSGSLVGGEQPKFTAVIQRGNESQTSEHVIVKFSPLVETPSGRRWADLLVCEHLALDTLNQNGIAAARTEIVEAGGRVFLEVTRFDRVGLKGRRPMITFSALDGDLGMADQTWTAVANQLASLGQLSVEDVETVEVLDLYGSLIGNADKHHGNMAVTWIFAQRYALLPAYDMLPMFFRPNADGSVVEREWKPALSGKLELRHLTRCHQMAEQFWNRVLSDSRISDGFRNGLITVSFPPPSK